MRGRNGKNLSIISEFPEIQFNSKGQAYQKSIYPNIYQKFMARDYRKNLADQNVQSTILTDLKVRDRKFEPVKLSSTYR